MYGAKVDESVSVFPVQASFDAGVYHGTFGPAADRGLPVLETIAGISANSSGVHEREQAQFDAVRRWTSDFSGHNYIGP